MANPEDYVIYGEHFKALIQYRKTKNKEPILLLEKSTSRAEIERAKIIFVYHDASVIRKGNRYGYEEIWKEHSTEEFAQLVNFVFANASDDCLFAMQISLKNSNSEYLHHAIPLIFNKKGEILYYCSINRTYDKQVNELLSIIQQATRKRGFIGAQKLWKIDVPQINGTVCTIYSSAALYSLEPNQSLEAQREPIKEMLQFYMKSHESQLALRIKMLKKVEKGECINNNSPKETYYNLQGSSFFNSQNSLNLSEKQPSSETLAIHLTKEQISEIQGLIARLNKEIKSCWPYPNKHKKEIKVQGLEKLLEKANKTDLIQAIKDIESEYPSIRDGKISTRTADLLDRLKTVPLFLQNHS